MSSSVSNLGLGGLISGMNTDDIINKITAIANQQIQQVQQQKADIVAQQDAWGKVRSALNTVRSALDGIRLSSDFRFRTATLSDTTVATVTATPGATVTSHSLNVTQLAKNEVVGSVGSITDGTKPLSDATNSVGLAGDGTLTINGKTVDVKQADTLYTLRDRINATAGVGVTAQVIKVVNGATTNYALTLTAATGGPGVISVSSAYTDPSLVAPPISDKLGLTSTGSVVDMVQGKNAIFSLDGVNYNTTSNVVNDAVPGLNITLQKENATTQITVAQNADQTATNVQTWVDAMNSAISLLTDLTKYDSSTGDKGVLNGDNLARDLRTQLKDYMSKQVSVNGKLMSLNDVGITSGAYGTADYGKMLLDKTKLTSALLADPDSVAKLFGGLRQNQTPLDGTTNPTSTTSDGGATFTPITRTFATAQTIDQIVLTTPDGGGTTGLNSFDVRYLDGATGTYKTLTSVTSYGGTSRTFSFDPVTTTEIQILPTKTYDNAGTTVSGLDAYEWNSGIATQLYRYVNSNLAFSTGALDTRNDTYNTQIKTYNDQIDKMNQKLVAQQNQLRAQFQAMEQAMQQLQAQGSQLSAMLGGSSK
ncbi:MAG: flagellar filament capping protein FliD [Mycobacterium leprae]